MNPSGTATTYTCSIAQEPDFVNSHSSIPENHFATTGDHIGSPLRDEGRARRRDGRPRPSEKREGSAKKDGTSSFKTGSSIKSNPSEDVPSVISVLQNPITVNSDSLISKKTKQGNKEKESSTRRTLHADVNTRKGANGELFLDDSISQRKSSVNSESSISENDSDAAGRRDVGPYGMRGGENTQP